MDHKHTYAKKKMKRSAIFTTGIGGVMIVGGLGVSLPIYFKIQEQLRKSYSEVVDLTVHLQELTDKLGIDPDEEFVKELSNGYVITFSSGRTKIYRKNDSNDAIIINSNADGTLGSAGTLSGAAARGMLNILHDVKNEFRKEEDAIEDILKPFVDDIEEKSIQIESAIIGLSPNEIRSRNALANSDSEAAKRSFDELQKKIKAAGEEEVSIDKIRNIVIDNRRKLKTNGNKLNLNERISKLKTKLKKAGSRLRKVYTKRILDFYKTWNGKLENSNMEEQNHEGWSKVKKYYNSIDVKDLMVKLKKLDTKELSLVSKKINEITTLISVQVKVEDIKSKKEIASNRPSIFSKLVSTPISLLNVLSKSLGYEGNPNDPVGKNSKTGSTTIINKLKSYASKKKYNVSDFNDIVNRLKYIGDWNTSTKMLRNRLVIKKVIDTRTFNHPIYKDWIIISVKGMDFNNKRNSRSMYMLFKIKKGEKYTYEKTSNETAEFIGDIIKDYMVNKIKEPRTEDLSIIFKSIKSMKNYKRLEEKLKSVRTLDDEKINRSLIRNEYKLIKNGNRIYKNDISNILLFRSVANDYRITSFDDDLLLEYLNDKYDFRNNIDKVSIQRIFENTNNLNIAWNKEKLINFLGNASKKLLDIFDIVNKVDWIDNNEKNSMGQHLFNENFKNPNSIQKMLNNFDESKFKKIKALNIKWTKNDFVKILENGFDNILKVDTLIGKLNSISPTIKKQITDKLVNISLNGTNSIQKIVNNFDKNKYIVDMSKLIRSIEGSSIENKIFDYIISEKQLINDEGINFFNWIKSISDNSIKLNAVKRLKKTLVQSLNNVPFLTKKKIELIEYLRSEKSSFPSKLQSKIVTGINKVFTEEKISNKFKNIVDFNLDFKKDALKIMRKNSSIDISLALNEKIAEGIENLTLKYPISNNMHIIRKFNGDIRNWALNNSTMGIEWFRQKIIETLWGAKVKVKKNLHKKISNIINVYDFLNNIFNEVKTAWNSHAGWTNAKIESLIKILLTIWGDWDRISNDPALQKAYDEYSKGKYLYSFVEELIKVSI